MLKIINILISSAGRQSFLVNAFQIALKGRGHVFASDFNPEATSLKTAYKGFIVPSFKDLEYVEYMLDLCKKQNIGLLLSLNVDDLLLLEMHRVEFNKIDCQLVGGPINSIKMTCDKYWIYQLCKELNLNSVNTWLLKEIESLNKINYPLIAKKRFGKGGRGQKILINEDQLNIFLKETVELSFEESYIFQEYMKGQEYGFDLINNFNCEFAGILVRRKISMKNGETNIAVTEPFTRWKNFGQLLSKALYHQGTIDIDAIVIDDKPFLLDINFRFGGGYIFSHLAGANIPKAYIAWYLNEPFNQTWLMSKNGVLSKRDEFSKKIIDF